MLILSRHTEDREVFINRFEQYYLMQNVMVDMKNNLLLMVLDAAVLTAVKKEQTEAERVDYMRQKKTFVKTFGFAQICRTEAS